MPSDRSVIAYRPDEGTFRKLLALQDETGLPMAQIVGLGMRAYIIKQEKDKQRLQQIERLVEGTLNPKSEPPQPAGEHPGAPPSSARSAVKDAPVEKPAMQHGAEGSTNRSVKPPTPDRSRDSGANSEPELALSVARKKRNQKASQLVGTKT